MNNDLTEFLEDTKPAQCPRCASARVAWVVFGKPTDEAMEDAQEEGDVVFGGCTLLDDAPPFYCKDCHLEWGLEELQRRQERKAQLPKAQQIELMRLSWERSFQERVEQAKRREARVIQYYRDRHARRLHPQSAAPQVFTVEYQGQAYSVGLNERGQLTFPHLQQKTASATAAPDDGFRTTLLRWWCEEQYELPDAMGEVEHLLRRRGKARRRYKQCRDPLTDSQSLRLMKDASRACYLARKTLEKCAYSFAAWSLVSVRSKTKHDIRLTVEPRPNYREQETDSTNSLARPVIKIDVTIAKARRWLHRVHYRGLSVLDGHFVFEVSEVIASDKLRVIAARETPTAELCLAPALAERDTEGHWHLQWLELV